MSDPMSKEEVELALEGIFIDDSVQKKQDRAVAHIINYIEANMDACLASYNNKR